MARSSLFFGSLPLLSLAVACATAVEQGFVDDDEGPGGGSSSQSGSASGGSNHSGSTSTSGSSSGGKGPSAFGGTASTMAGSGGTATAGSANGGSGSGGSAMGGTGGSSAGGSSTGGGAQSGGSGGQQGGGGQAGQGSSGSSSGGSGGSGPVTSTGECAPAGTGWVVQYWTDAPATAMPAGNYRIFNDTGQSVNFTALELRHYFTNEETATLSFTFSTFGHNFPTAPYFEDENGANVQSSIQTLAPAVATASHFIRVKFNATPGNFGDKEWAQLGFYASLSMYPQKSNQANDYTYIGHATTDPGSSNKTAGWDHVTLYVGGDLVWGCEP